jgi:hypothetical protein
MSTQATLSARKTTGCGCGCHSGNISATLCTCGGCGCNLCATPTIGYIRPQFFSGQLLTEDDLRSLVDYVVGKNRLHNRMLFGDGVVCGLKVTIDPCPSPQPCVHQEITVHAGYALDCCGNDIFVPCDVTLDFPQLLRDLKQRLLGKDCGEPCEKPDPANDKKTNEKIRTYCLYVRYCEQSSDPVVPYDSDQPCGITDCHDTRIREGFRFELRCPPQQPTKTSKQLTNRMLRLYQAEYLQKPINTLKEAFASGAPQDLLAAVDRIEEALSLAPVGDDTEVEAQLAKARADVRAGASREQVVLRVAASLLRYWSRGSCDVLLPDCAPCDDDAVLIACLDVDGCDVVSVCNVRRRMILSPAYFEFLGLPDLITQFLTEICCGDRKRFVPGDGERQRNENLRAWLTCLRSRDPIPSYVAEPAQVERAFSLLSAAAEEREPGVAEPPTPEDPYSLGRYLARTVGLATRLDWQAEDRRLDELLATVTMQTEALGQQDKALKKQAEEIEQLRKLVGTGAGERGRKRPPSAGGGTE